MRPLPDLVAGVRIGLTKILGGSDPYVILSTASVVGLLVPRGAFVWISSRGFAGVLALQ